MKTHAWVIHPQRSSEQCLWCGGQTHSVCFDEYTEADTEKTDRERERLEHMVGINWHTQLSPLCGGTRRGGGPEKWYPLKASPRRPRLGTRPRPRSSPEEDGKRSQVVLRCLGFFSGATALQTNPHGLSKKKPL